MDDMAIVDHVSVLLVIWGTATPQHCHLGRAKEADEAIVVDAHGDAGDPRLARVLEAVAVEVVPDEITDLRGGELGQGDDVADAVGRAEGAGRPRGLDLEGLDVLAGGVTEPTEAGRGVAAVAPAGDGAVITSPTPGSWNTPPAAVSFIVAPAKLSWW